MLQFSVTHSTSRLICDWLFSNADLHGRMCISGPLTMQHQLIAGVLDQYSWSHDKLGGNVSLSRTNVYTRYALNSVKQVSLERREAYDSRREPDTPSPLFRQRRSKMMQLSS